MRIGANRITICRSVANIFRSVAAFLVGVWFLGCFVEINAVWQMTPTRNVQGGYSGNGWFIVYMSGKSPLLSNGNNLEFHCQRTSRCSLLYPKSAGFTSIYVIRYSHFSGGVTTFLEVSHLILCSATVALWLVFCKLANR